MRRAFLFLLILVFVFGFIGEALAVSDEDTPPLFYLVAGSFQELENAEKQQEELYLYRYYSRLMGYPIDGVIYWRVIVAQDKEKGNLEGMKQLLAEDGFETFFAYDSGDESERPVSDPEPIPVSQEERETRQFILDLIAWLSLQLERH